MKFEGTDTYIATEDLMVAVNAAIRLERPVLVSASSQAQPRLAFPAKPAPREMRGPFPEKPG